MIILFLLIDYVSFEGIEHSGIVGFDEGDNAEIFGLANRGDDLIQEFEIG